MDFAILPLRSKDRRETKRARSEKVVLEMMLRVGEAIHCDRLLFRSSAPGALGWIRFKGMFLGLCLGVFRGVPRPDAALSSGAH